MAISLAELKRRSAVVSTLVKDVTNCRIPNEEDQNSLCNEYDVLYSMILDIAESLDAVISDVEK